MATFLIILQLLVVLAMIFIGAKVGSIGLGIYGMVGVFILVFCFGLEPGIIPVDVMLIIVSVITASAALQAAGGLDYMVSIAAKLLKRHPSRITFYAPFITWFFCFLAGTAHTCYALDRSDRSPSPRLRRPWVSPAHRCRRLQRLSYPPPCSVGRE